jgi:chemotaxis protein CheD
MLPESQIDAGRARTQPMMFADLGIPAAVASALSLGAEKRRLEARLIGGAAVPGGPSGFDIGKRNTLAARKILWQTAIQITGQEVGGDIARTVHLDVFTGRARISTPGIPAREIG